MCYYLFQEARQESSLCVITCFRRLGWSLLHVLLPVSGGWAGVFSKCYYLFQEAGLESSPCAITCFRRLGRSLLHVLLPVSGVYMEAGQGCFPCVITCALIGYRIDMATLKRLSILFENNYLPLSH